MGVPLFHVDAFTDRAFGGNPAAVCFLDFWLDDRMLRKVAAENNLPATAFLTASPEGYELRWFSPVCELKLCGHATLAAAFVLFRFLRPELDQVQFSTSFRGLLTVRRVDDQLLMEFPILPSEPCEVGPGLLQALGSTLQPTDIEGSFLGNETYVVIFRKESQIQNFRPDFSSLQKLHPRTLVITAPGDHVNFVSRYFAPGYGIPEDFVTGSSHCLLMPIWSKRLGKTSLHARQLSTRQGEVKCQLKGDRVILQGQAVAIKRGWLSI